MHYTVIPNGNVVTLQFPRGNEPITNTSGFKLYLDAKMQHDIGGGSYDGFTTVYRNDDETAKANSYQLSNDGSVYIAPPPSEPVPEPGLSYLHPFTEKRECDGGILRYVDSNGILERASERDTHLNVMRVIKPPILFGIGGLIYVMIGLIWRGYDHWTMFLDDYLCY